MLEELSKAVLHIKGEKFEFYKQDLKYLRLIVRQDGVNIDQDKVVVVKDWELPQSTFNLLSFVCFVNFY